MQIGVLLMVDGFVNIHGKQYATVAHRLQQFRKEYPKAQIVTKLHSDDGKKVIMNAFIRIDERILATGWAEEVRGSSNINRTSALENCETSAIGRALAIAGFDTSGSIASAEEVSQAIEQQKQQIALPNTKPLIMTKKQRSTIEAFLDECSDGDLKLEKLLKSAGVDNLSRLPRPVAEQYIKQINLLNIKA